MPHSATRSQPPRSRAARLGGCSCWTERPAHGCLAASRSWPSAGTGWPRVSPPRRGCRRAGVPRRDGHPQVAPQLLDAGLGALDGADAVFGAALDGGYWASACAAPIPRFRDVPMSQARRAWPARPACRARPAHRGPAAAPRRRHDPRRARCRADAPANRFAATLASIEGRHHGCDGDARRGPSAADSSTAPAPSAAQRLAPSLRRRACARSTACSSRCRSTAGSAGSTPPRRGDCARRAPVLASVRPGRLWRRRARPARQPRPRPLPRRVRLARRRGAAAIRAVFGFVPGAGRYRTVLLSTAC